MRWIVFVLCLLVPANTLALTLEGKDYEASITVAGRQLKLIGAGLREVYGFNVYTLGAYSEDGDCEEKNIVESEQVKYLRLDILRNIDAEKVARRIAEAFAENMPQDASMTLQKQRDQSFSYFNGRCLKGTVFEFIYIPGKGTIFKQNGKAIGPIIPGKDYHTVFWNVYFGPNTCCSDLKDQLLVECMPEPEATPYDPLGDVYRF